MSSCKENEKRKGGIDDILMEIFLYGGTPIREGLVELLTKIWKEKSISEKWKMTF